MTADECEKLPPEEKEHFAKRSKCDEIFDRRSVRAVLVACMVEQYLVKQFWDPLTLDNAGHRTLTLI